MSRGRATRRKQYRARAEFWAIRYSHQQRRINQTLLKEVEDVCYYVPNLRGVA